MKGVKYIVRNKNDDSVDTKRSLHCDDNENGNYVDNMSIL